MLLNTSGWLGEVGGGGNTTIIQGSKNNIVSTVQEMNAITSPKKGDICHVTTTKELYMYKDSTWTIIPTGDMFYNNLASLTNTGHVQLTSDITSVSEELAITPKALKDAIEEVKSLINNSPNESSNWEEWNL